jgi:hypothetical protein
MKHGYGMLAVLAASVLVTTGCNGSSRPTAAKNSPATTSAVAAAVTTTGASAVAAPSSRASTSVAAISAAGGGHKCADLTNAAASAAVGKPTTVTLDATGASLPSLSICKVTVADEVYPIQLDVNTTNGAQVFAAEKRGEPQAQALSGVGEQAFTTTIGVEALEKGIDITVVGPAGAVLGGNFAIPTALAKAMAAAIG